MKNGRLDMKKLVPMLALVLAVGVGVVWAVGVNITGNWQANVLGTVIKASVNQNGRAISGVANVYNLFGKKDVYHFTGAVDNGRINASHHSGHVFSGNVSSGGQIEGVLRTANGHKVGVVATRF
jgi:hypothetical protein